MLSAVSPLKPPTNCDCCGAPAVVLTTNRAAYGPNALDPDSYLYRCRVCRAAVGVHPGTTIPMGRMADAGTRSLRIKAHVAFDPIWQVGATTRKRAYRLLADALGIDAALCHISMLTKEQLHATIQFCRDYRSEANVIRRRREAKRIMKAQERNERERNQRKRDAADEHRNNTSYRR